MKPEHLKQLIAAQQAATEPLTAKATAQEFKGGYAPTNFPILIRREFDNSSPIGWRMLCQSRGGENGKRFWHWKMIRKNSVRLKRTLTRVAVNVIWVIRALQIWFRKISGITMV